MSAKRTRGCRAQRSRMSRGRACRRSLRGIAIGGACLVVRPSQDSVPAHTRPIKQPDTERPPAHAGPEARGKRPRGDPFFERLTARPSASECEARLPFIFPRAHNRALRVLVRAGECAVRAFHDDAGNPDMKVHVEIQAAEALHTDHRAALRAVEPGALGPRAVEREGGPGEDARERSVSTSA